MFWTFRSSCVKTEGLKLRSCEGLTQLVHTPMCVCRDGCVCVREKSKRLSHGDLLIGCCQKCESKVGLFSPHMCWPLIISDSNSGPEESVVQQGSCFSFPPFMLLMGAFKKRSGLMYGIGLLLLRGPNHSCFVCV